MRGIKTDKEFNVKKYDYLNEMNKFIEKTYKYWLTKK